MQRGAAHRRASNGDGRQHSHRRQLASAPHLHANVIHARDRRARSELVGDGPSRGAASETKALLLRGGVNLNDHSINFVAEIGALLLGFVNEGDQFLNRRQRVAMRIHAKARCRQAVQRLHLGREKCLAIHEDEVGIKIEAALRHDVRLQRADRPGGSVARIGLRLQALRFRFLIHAQKGREGHHYLTAHFKCRGQLGVVEFLRRDRQRRRANRPHIVGHIFANAAVAACHCADEVRSPTGARLIMQCQ